MEHKRSFTFFLVTILLTLLTVGLAACERSLGTPASTKPKSQPTTESNIAPQTTNDVMSQLELFVTQTAMAASGQAVIQQTPAPAQETPVPAEPTLPEQPVNPTQPSSVLPPMTPPNLPTVVPVLPTTAPQVVNVPPPTPGVPASYTLQKDEFPFCIARRFNVSPTELLSLNGLGTNTTVYAGYLLRIPQTGNPFVGSRTLKPHPTTYAVAGGQTIYAIACQFGDVDPMAIAAANGLKEPYTLTPGQTLQIP